MKNLVLLILLLSIFSCKKAADRMCFKSSGNESSLRIDLPEFNKLRLNKRLDYTLVQDDSNYLVIRGGENLLNLIDWFEYEAGTLEISNHNKCNFLRDLSKNVLIEIHFKTLNEVVYSGTGLLNNSDTLKLDSFYFIIVDASGSIDFTVDANHISGEITEGSGDFTLRGKCNSADFSIRSNGYCNSEFLEVKSNFNIVNKSPGNLYVNASNCNLTGFIKEKGNIYYKGTPATIDMKTLSTGKLLPY